MSFARSEPDPLKAHLERRAALAARARRPPVLAAPKPLPPKEEPFRPTLEAWLRSQPVPSHGGERLGRELVLAVLSGAHDRTCWWFEREVESEA